MDALRAKVVSDGRAALGRLVAALGAIGVVAPLALKWAEVHAQYQTDDQRWRYAGAALHSSFGMLGAVLTAVIAGAGLGAFAAAAIAEATKGETPRTNAVVWACGAVALSAVALAGLGIRVAGAPPGWTDTTVSFHLGIFAAAVSAVMVLVGGLYGWSRDRRLQA